MMFADGVGREIEIEAGLMEQLLETFELQLQCHVVRFELVQPVPVVGVLVFQHGRPPLQRVHVFLLLPPTLLR